MSPWPGQLSSALISVPFQWLFVGWTGFKRTKAPGLSFCSRSQFSRQFLMLSDVKINVFPLSVRNWEWQNTPRKDVLIAFPAGTRRIGCQKTSWKSLLSGNFQPHPWQYSSALQRHQNRLHTPLFLKATPCSLLPSPLSHTSFLIPGQSHSTCTYPFQQNEL